MATTTKKTAAQILASLQDEKAVDAILNSAAFKNMLGSNAKANTTTQTDPLALAKKLGLIYDRDEIANTYEAAANAGNAVLDQQYQNSVGNFYQGLGAQSSQVLDALRKAQGQSAANGATSGMNAANTLSALLGQTQGSSADSLALALQGVELGKQKSADLVAARRDALDAYNKLGTDVYGLMNDANSVTAQNIATYGGLGQSAVGAQSAANDRNANTIMHNNELISNEAIAALAANAQKSAAGTAAAATRDAAKLASGYTSNADKLASTTDLAKRLQAELDKLKKQQPAPTVSQATSVKNKAAIASANAPLVGSGGLWRTK